MYTWNWDPGLVFGLVMQAIVYLACVGPLRRYFPGSASVSQVRIQTFLLGVLILFFALVSPLHTLGDQYLLSAHMVQHLLITLVAPPLLLVGTPRWLFRPLLRLPFAPTIGRFITSLLVAFLAFNIVFAAWHVPAFYDLALQYEWVHAAEHISFIVTATLTWWPIFSPMDEFPAPAPPVQCLYLFFQSLPPTVVGALITFSGDVLYPTYANAPRVWGLSALADQQIAGLIMWFPGGLVFFGVLTVIFLRWFSRDDYEPVSDGVV
jgi:putative membrane protein